MPRLSYLAIAASFVLGFGMFGCSNPATNSTNSKTPANTPSTDNDNHDGHMNGDHMHDEHEGSDMKDSSAMDKMIKGLANLSESDQASAMKQHMCPVSGEMLGTMGEPIKVTVKDQEVWICCNSCKDDLLADPDKYLAKLKK